MSDGRRGLRMHSWGELGGAEPDAAPDRGSHPGVSWFSPQAFGPTARFRSTSEALSKSPSSFFDTSERERILT